MKHHFDGKKFNSPDGPPMATWKRVMRWWFSRRERGHWPKYWDAPDELAAKHRDRAARARTKNASKKAPATAPAVVSPATTTPDAASPAHIRIHISSIVAKTPLAAKVAEVQLRAADTAAGNSPMPPKITWVNHSTFLIETADGNFITDPVYSRSAGPLGLFGPRRHHRPGVPFDALPKINYVLLSHDHYDHCDLRTLEKLAERDAPVGITLLGNGDLFAKAGFQRIIELDWWHVAVAPHSGATVTATPAQHWSCRATGPRCGRLWGGFWLTLGNGKKIYFAGDTGYNAKIFREIHRRLGSPDLAMLPIGAYAPRWFMHPQHCDPAQAVKIHTELGAHRSVAMHWGCFRLTDEAHDDPPKELAAVLKKKHISPETFRVLIPGESVQISD